MWDETLIECRKNQAAGKRWFSVPVSVIAHAAVFGMVIGFSYWSLEALPPPPSREPYWGVKVSFGPPPATIRRQKSNRAVEAARPTKIEPLTTEPVITDQSGVGSNETLAGDSSNDSASVDGIEGGLPGGVGVGFGSEFGSVEQDPIVMNAEVQKPVLIKKVIPVYPPAALRGRIQGVVLLQAVISKTGSVEDVTLLQSTNRLLTQAAIDAVKQWEYKPALLQGRPVRVYFNVTVEFRIE
jgi:protein TonB